MNSTNAALTSILALILGLAIGFFAGYNMGMQSGKSLNTIQFGPDHWFQWKENK